ncbi:uncharacterized protein LOC101862200 [Aplysia californica]|uniref:Uncharacterized protein LOC101862200 n=1 Tax=Aplysia californica TaxID=6500 RepID=A0ABM1VXF9_APLCA|nr:uncharacterized protein LOC101862200 [Aplysia californica]XP_035827102.1 uncharacterized protein LOC101862200 [Aplysia californica]
MVDEITTRYGLQEQHVVSIYRNPTSFNIYITLVDTVPETLLHDTQFQIDSYTHAYIQKLTREKKKLYLSWVPPSFPPDVVEDILYTFLDKNKPITILPQKHNHNADRYLILAEFQEDDIPHYVQVTLDNTEKTPELIDILVTLPNRPVACHSCGVPGHWASNCPRVTGRYPQHQPPPPTTSTTTTTNSYSNALRQAPKQNRGHIQKTALLPTPTTPAQQDPATPRPASPRPKPRPSSPPPDPPTVDLTSPTPTPNTTETDPTAHPNTPHTDTACSFARHLTTNRRHQHARPSTIRLGQRKRKYCLVRPTNRKHRNRLQGSTEKRQGEKKSRSQLSRLRLLLRLVCGRREANKCLPRSSDDERNRGPSLLVHESRPSSRRHAIGVRG